jgi:hypothetical protein
VLLFFAKGSFSQSEEVLKVDADKLFYAGKYLDATPLYLRLLSVKPRSYEYNFRYGACLIYNSNRKLESLKYLRVAALDPSGLPPEFHYFYGKSLHLSYLFNDAIKEYKLYNQTKLKETPVYEVIREIEMCENGKRLMTTITDIIVTDKKEISVDKFFRIYDLSNIGGSLLVTAEFQTKLDKKYNHTPLIHFPANPKVIYYSSYGDKGENGKDIYVRRKLPDNSWGQPQELPGEVNTPFDEDFPYMHPDGDYLYFSSKGHNTMGGYDVFRSKYDKETNMFGKPENMDFAISSPDDDVFYVVDSLNKDAVFASSRQSQEGFLHVYKVKVDRVPLQMAVVKGDFKSMVDTSYKDIDFTIRDYSNGDFIGKFNSNEKGTYLITFPKGGKYEFVMTVNDGPQEFRSIVTIPFMKEFKPLKQMIVHVAENGVENVKIVNQFDQVVDEPADVMAEVIQKRGELNVNVNEFDMKKIEESKQTNSILAELGYGKLNNVEVAYSLQDQIKKGIENKSNIESLSNNINNLVVENTSEFLNLEEQIKQKVAASNNVTEADQKYKLLKEAKLLMEQQQEIKDYSADLIGLRDSISNVLNSANSIRDLDKLKILSGQFDKLLAEGNEADALSLLASNRIMLQGILKDTAANLMENLVDRSVVFDNQIVGLNAKVDVFNRDISTLQLQIQTLQNSLEAAKSKEAEDIKSRIASKEEEIMLIEEERELLQKSINKIRQEKYVVSQQMELLKDAISNKSLVAVSAEQSTTRLKETEKPNTNSLNSFVEQQVSEIEKKDPTIKDRVVVVNNLSAQNIYNEYKNSDQGIKDDPNLNAEARLYKMLSNERKALRMINKRLEDIAKLQSSVTSSNPQLAAEKESLENYRRELNALVQQHELDIRTVVSSKDVLAENKQGNSVQPKNTSSQPVVLTPQEAIAQVDPGYQSRKDVANSTKGLTNQQKLEALNKEDTRMLTAVNSELSAVNDQLKKTPNDVSLQNKQQALQQAKNSTEEIVQQRNKEIDAAKQVAANQNPANQQKQGPQSTITAQNESELLTQLDPEYQNRTQKITANQGMTEAQKVEYLNAQDNKLLTTIKNEIVKLNSDATQNPTDQKILAKKELLEELKAKTESAIQTRNEQLIAGNTTSANTAGQNKQTEQVAEEKNATEQQNPAKPLSAAQITAQVDPTYENRAATINANNSLNTEQKLAALNTEDQKLLTSVEAELKKVTNQLAATPNDKTLLERKSTLTEIKTEKQSAIEQREKEIAAAKEIAANTAGQNKQAEQVVEDKNVTEQQNPAKPLSAAQITAQVDPTYENRAATINANNSLNTEQKLAALNAEDQKLLTSVEAELKKVTNQLAATPNDKTLLERKSTLTEIKTEKQSAIEQREKEIAAAREIAANTVGQNKQAEQVVEDKNVIEQQNSSKPLTAEQITAQVDPTYENRAATINANNALNAEQKLAALNAEDQKLLTSVEAELKKLTNQLAASPNDKILLERKSTLTEIKTEKQSAIEQREKEIAANQAAQNKLTEQQTNNIAATEEQQISKLSPKYNEEIKSIENNKALTDDQKLIQLQEKDKLLLLEINKQKAEIEKSLAKNPTNEQLKKEQEQLQTLGASVEARSDEREQLIASKLNEKVTPELVEKSKLETIKSVDPQYEQNIAASKNQASSELDRSMRELKVEQDLQKKITSEQLSLNKLLDKDPTNAELLIKKQALSELKAENDDRISLLNQDVTNLKAGKPLISVNETDKTQEVTDLNPEYSEKQKEILSSSMSQEEKNTALMEQEQDLRLVLIARTELLQEELKTKPNDREIQKELKVLEALKLDNENRIDELDRSLGNTVISELSPEQERSIVEKLDPTFNQKTTSLTENNTLSAEQKQQELLAADQQLLSRTYNRQEEIDQQLARNPSDAKLKEEQNQLSVLSRNLESKIELRQEEVNRLSEISATTAPVKEATIKTVDAAYRESISAIVNSNKSEAEKNASILILEKELLAKVEAAVQNKSMQQQQAESPELKKELLTLSAIKQDLEKSIGEKEAAANVASQPVNAESKSAEIARIDASFEADVKAVNQNQSLTEKQKQEQLLERESRLLNELKAEKQATNQQLQKAPTNDALKQRLAVLTAVENDLTSSISSRQTNLNASEDKNSEIDKTNLIASVQPDYDAQKETLRNSKMEESKKIAEQLKLEQGLLSKLEAEKESVEKSLQKDPSNTALQKQSNLLSETIEIQKTTISSLPQQQVNVAEQRKNADAIAKVDVGYVKEMEQLSAGGNSRNTEMIERENKHQELISKKIIENEAKLATISNNQLKSETDALRNELQASEQREEKLKTEEQAVSAKQDVFVENFRKEQLKEKFGVVDANYTEKSELVNQDAQLAIYENQLNLAVSKQDEILQSNPSNTVEKEKMDWLKSELSLVQNKRRSIKISIGELEKVEVIAENNTDQRYNDPSLNQLNSQEAQLTNNLADNSLTKKERQGIQKELDAVQQKQAMRENELMANEIVDQKNTNEAIAKELKDEKGVNEAASLNARATILSNESVQKEIAVLNEKVAQTKNPEEKKYILNEIIEKQEALNIQLKESLVENKIQQLQKENDIESLETEQALEAKKRRYMIQVGEISKVINELDQQIAAAKPKQAAVLIQEKELKIQQKNLVEQQITLLDKQLASKSTVSKTLSDEAMKQNVGYAEEKEIATTEVYKNYVEKALPALQLEKQITTLDNQLQQERSLSKQLIATSIDQPTEENYAKMQANALRIAELEKELNATKQQLVNSQALANAALPKDKTEAMKMQNLLKRGVEPIQRAVLIAALVPMPASGLEINKAAVTTSMAKPIPVDVKSASGLVYRVQVGAFSKPIPQDRFREFNPVSGETLNNGITRYMAGYFNSSKNVLDARNKIRAIGYADAFAIAYCDGKRISLAEARALELSKQCLPKGENELVLEMAANTAEKMGLTISDSLTPAVEAMPIITETDYNNVPGGVKADPVENHLGLFYTVQVGVFNNPINAKVVSNMAPLISNRLPNGQIRYSSGMFNSIDEARPKKQEAIDKGIKDAFITAYYKSQRITLAEAEQLLKENGEVILESKQVQKTEGNNTQVSSPNAGVVPSIKSEIKIDPSLLISETKTIEAVQIVTKKTFDEFPREILNRYNSHGSFYYDENDKKVKSAIADSRESLPQVFYFKDDIDTVVVQKNVSMTAKVVKVEFMGSSMPGDFGDWLLRFNYRREFKRNDLKTELRIFDVPEEKVTVLLTKLEEFGLKGTIE